MWDYSEKLLDHFYNPRNMGELEDANGVGMVGSIACGDAMKLYLKIEDDGKISDARFETFGCGSAIASASAITEMIIGKSIEEAKEITNNDIAEFIEGIPPEKMHCSVMGREALEAALNDFRGIATVETHEDEGKIVCHCFGVTDEKIKRVALENNLHTLQEITNYTKAGGGCTLCHGEIEDILKAIWSGEEVKREREVDAPPQLKKELTNIQKIMLIQETIENEIRPSLRKDGGDIDLIDVEGNKVIVALRGTCTECHASQLTLKGLVESRLREFVTEDLEVVLSE